MSGPGLSTTTSPAGEEQMVVPIDNGIGITIPAFGVRVRCGQIRVSGRRNPENPRCTGRRGGQPVNAWLFARTF